jgi:transcriptional regulator of arginine metabolism
VKKIPQSRYARRQLIVDLLRSHVISSQAQLVDLLADKGFDVTQATVSRDLDDVGAIKTSTGDGLVYAVPAPTGESATAEGRLDRLMRVLEEMLVSVDHSGPIVVLRTPPGGASYMASALDEGILPEVIGSVAGDDTVFLVARQGSGGEGAAALAETLLTLAAGRRPAGISVDEGASNGN